MLRKLLPLLLLFCSLSAISQSFTSIWDTEQPGSPNTEIRIPTNPAFTYNYAVNWGDGVVENNITGDAIHTYTTPGIYTIEISGDFPAIYFNNAGDRRKIIEILDWGNINWQSMDSAFEGCTNLNFDAISAPDLTNVSTLKDMFRGCTSFNGILNNWNVSGITNISGMFADAIIFNRPLDNWTTSAMTDMSFVFEDARQFNEPLDNWNTASVTTMENMFKDAQQFNQNINSWAVSQVTNMSGTFEDASNFNRPLNNWNVSNVTTMARMFRATPFDQNISSWNVSNVTDMSEMFSASTFNQPIEIWNVSSVTNMYAMFMFNRFFDQPLNLWNVSAVTDMSAMFRGANSNPTLFNQPLDGWDVSSVTDMSRMFMVSQFNQPLNDWDVISVTDMSGMFSGSTSYTNIFNQALNLWDVDNVTDMSSMFYASSFNQPIDNWNVSSVENMSSMFSRTPDFNQPLNNWILSSLNDVSSMFQNAVVFNQPLNNWDTSLVTTLQSMFMGALAFNQPLNNWNVSAVNDMRGMFSGTSVNPTIFNQPLDLWDITGVQNMNNMFDYTAVSLENYDTTLLSWGAQSVTNDVTLGVVGLTYCDGRDARQNLIDNYGWNITGDSVNCSFVLCTSFISPQDGDTNVPANFDLRWNPAPNATGYYVSLSYVRGGSSFVLLNNSDEGNVVGLDFTNDFLPGDIVTAQVIPYNGDGPAANCEEITFTVVPNWRDGTDAFKLTIDTSAITSSTNSNANQLRISARPGVTYNYSIDWGDNQFDNNVDDTITHTYLNPGVYTIAIIGDYPAHYYPSPNSDNQKLLTIDQWGTIQWETMESAFYSCRGFTGYNATDTPNLSGVTDMSRMFESSNFNGNINNWDVSNVENMARTFIGMSDFNQPLNDWDVSKVTTMNAMFLDTDNFNQPLDQWDVSNVTDMARMFDGFSNNMSFNQNLNDWDVRNVTDMTSMFSKCVDFNQPLNNWVPSSVTTMFEMFDETRAFNQDISNWDVSSVTNMSAMFRQANSFDQPLDDWTVSSVQNMTAMFQNATNFNQTLNQWDVSNVSNMSFMFDRATSFNAAIGDWDVENVTNMQAMFRDTPVFNQNIETWNVTSAINMSSMFEGSLAFNSPLNNWDVNSVVTMASMFKDAMAFNQPIASWEVSAVATMSSMFENATLFNQDIQNWDVSSVTIMNSMFEGAEAFASPMQNWNVGSVTRMDNMFKNAISFNSDINNWNTGEVLTMQEMFSGASNFNQNIDSWNVSFVTTMQEMFKDATSFNQNLNSWNVASVNTMSGMFQNATDFNGTLMDWNTRAVTTMENMFMGASSFNQSVNNWRMAGVRNMDNMFNGASAYNQPMELWRLGEVSMNGTFFNANALNQYLGDWDVSDVTDMSDMLDNTALDRENYDNTLIAWSELTLNSGINLGAEGLLYCAALTQRQSIIDTYGWTITQDILDCPIPECTQLTAPLNNAIDVPLNTNLTWEPVLYADEYILTVRVDPGNRTIVNEQSVTENYFEFTSEFLATDTTVYVSIAPQNGTGRATCVEESFTLTAAPTTVPDCTLLTEPDISDPAVSISTNISWNPINNADSYELSIGTTPGGSEILPTTDVGNRTTYELINDLPEDQDIFVMVRPRNELGIASACVEEVFHTEIIPVAPGCTQLSSSKVDVPVDADLTWDAIANADGYLVIVGTTQGGNEIVNNEVVNNDTTYSFNTNLLEGRTYYVTIIPFNEVGDASGCLEESITTENNATIPSCTTLTFPATLTDVPLDTNLSWDASNNTTGYLLSIGTTSGGSEIFTGDINNVTTFNPTSDLPASTEIFVQITPYNIIGPASACTEFSFMTAGPPLCTTLNSPQNNEINVDATISSISWDASDSADGYDVTILAENSTANNGTFRITSGTTHNFTSNFTPGEIVEVTIIPYNSLGNSGTCATERFTITPPPVPNCTTLTSDLTNVALRPTITWDASTAAEGYKLTVLATNSTVNNVTEFDVTSGTTYTFDADFEPGESVEITLVPYNSFEEAVGCSAEIMNIKPLPSCTTLNAPVDGSFDISPNTTISWNAITDATGYILNVSTSESTANTLTDFVVTTGSTYDFTNDFIPGETVSVTITPYNEIGNALGCTTESFTIKPVPACTNLVAPENGSIEIPVNPTLEWNLSADAIGYRLTVMASVSTANNITDLNITNGTSYAFPNDFEQGETVSVTITPYNEVGDALGCITESFTIKSVPICTNLISPSNGEVVGQANDITWTPISNADGYKITISGSNTTINNVTDFEFSGTTYVFPNQFTQGEVVTVTIIPYNELGDAVGCTSERFTIRPIPNCTNLVTPLNNATNIPVTSDISWNPSFDADGYRISVGTSPGGTDIVNYEDVASLTSYTFGEDLPSETLIYVTVFPYNTSGIADGCDSESFTTEIIAPDCSTLISPSNGDSNVPLAASIRWEEIDKTDGYRLSIGTSLGGTDILNNLEMGMTTTYSHNEEFPFDTELFITITPYNSAGDAFDCEQQSFTTAIPEDETLYGFSPDGDGINDFWYIDHIEDYPENVVTIYNRWGDMVFQVDNYDNTSRVFSGTANMKTGMGASTLPNGTYFFNIQIDGETILRKTQGFLVLKR